MGILVTNDRLRHPIIGKKVVLLKPNDRSRLIYPCGNDLNPLGHIIYTDKNVLISK